VIAFGTLSRSTLMGEALDVVYREAVVHDAVVDDRDIRDVGRPIDDGRILMPIDRIAVRSPRRETLWPDERPETDVDVDAVAAPIPIAGIPAGIGRQRRPADVIVVLAERDSQAGPQTRPGTHTQPYCGSNAQRP
jgi:hypothetical protein